MNEHITLQAKYSATCPTFINLKKERKTKVMSTVNRLDLVTAHNTLPCPTSVSTRHETCADVTVLSQKTTLADYWTGIA